jgi:hypothetical protein
LASKAFALARLTTTQRPRGERFLSWTRPFGTRGQIAPLMRARRRPSERPVAWTLTALDAV